MHILERLYDGVETHLKGPDKDWPGFSRGFRRAFASDVALYRMLFEAGAATASGMEAIASSNLPLLHDYIERRIYEMAPIPETTLAPLEPSRRTDDFTDAEFAALGPMVDYLIGNGIYYQMVVPAVMPDGSFLGLFVWRDRGEPDFSDIEKQRLALLMRHLLAVVSEDHLVPAKPDPDVERFGTTHGLTATETEILAGLLHGESLRAIAQSSGRSYGTVRWHVQNILQKCQVTSQRTLLSEFYRLIKA